MKKSWVALLLGLLLGPQAWSEDVFSFEHVPVVMGSAGPTEVFLNVLVPRLKDYRLSAYLESSGRRRKTLIDAEPVGEPQTDPSGQTHFKVQRYRLSGLKPGAQYVLNINEMKWGKVGDQIDSRTFRTLVPDSKDLRFAAGSCMSDEQIYYDVKMKLWRELLSRNPDLVVLMGDHTYIDSFDFVRRGEATSYDVWQRGIDSFRSLPLAHAKHLPLAVSTWDDHDTGINNGYDSTVTAPEARRMFQALWGSENVEGVIEVPESDGVQKHVRIAGQNFILLDTRSYRKLHTDDSRYAHIGREQEAWLLRVMKENDGPFWLVSGDMWGSPLVTKPSRRGGVKRLIEGFHADHPTNYRELMGELDATEKSFVLLSGDIHFSQVTLHGPEWEGTPRESDLQTAEITLSPMHSILFHADPGKEVFWEDEQRLMAARDHNFGFFESEALESGGLEYDLRAISWRGEELFGFADTVDANSGFESSRRRFIENFLLDDRVEIEAGQVKVAFFDLDGTLRVAPSGRPTANAPDDVMVLPGTADRIAELRRNGWLVIPVTNQLGFSYGYTTREIIEGAIWDTLRKLRAINPGAIFHYFDYAEWDDFFRKPNPGMARRLVMELEKLDLTINWEKSFMVGDSVYDETTTDRQGRRGTAHSCADALFAQGLGIRYFSPERFFGWSEDLKKAAFDGSADGVRQHQSEYSLPTLENLGL